MLLLCVYKRAMHLSKYRSVGYWSREINGTLTGGRKKVIFLFAVLTVTKLFSRTSGMRSIRGPDVSLGSIRVDTGREQSPTPYTLALGSCLPILLAA